MSVVTPGSDAARVPEDRAGTVSVVLPVHAGVAPSAWAAALKSLAAQTRCPHEIVVVADGPLPAELERCVEECLARPASGPCAVGPGEVLAVRWVRLPVNRGAGVANQAGLEAALGTWVAKADSDDVNLPERLAVQLAALAPGGSAYGVDVLGAAMWEVDESDGVPSGAGQAPRRLRAQPLGHDAIAARMRWNNPVNHPTVVFRREAALAAGGYGDLRYMQDYDLFARMLRDGARFANLPDPLVLFRSGRALRARRTGREFLRREVDLQRRLVGYGVVGRASAARNVVVRGGFRLLPDRATAAVYDHLLARRVRVPERMLR